MQLIENPSDYQRIMALNLLHATGVYYGDDLPGGPGITTLVAVNKQIVVGSVTLVEHDDASYEQLLVRVGEQAGPNVRRKVARATGPRRLKAPVLELSLACVDPGWQRRGLGNVSLHNLLRSPRFEQARAAIAWCWRHGDNESLPLLVKSGFRAVTDLEDVWSDSHCPKCGDVCACDATVATWRNEPMITRWREQRPRRR